MLKYIAENNIQYDFVSSLIQNSCGRFQDHKLGLKLCQDKSLQSLKVRDIKFQVYPKQVHNKQKSAVIKMDGLTQVEEEVQV